MKPRHPLFLFSCIHTQEIGDGIYPVGARDGAFARRDFTRNELLGKAVATGLSAGTAIGAGQHLFDLLDTRILINAQVSVRNSEQCGEE
jgi:hypothetical protein